MGERHVRALRGATTVARDDPALVRAATRELLAAMLERNALGPEDVVSALFTVTDDLHSEFPARAARELGWADVPLLCAVEAPVPAGPPRCVRVMLHVETDRPRDRLVHVRLGEGDAAGPAR